MNPPLPTVEICLTAPQVSIIHDTLEHFGAMHVRWQRDPSLNSMSVFERRQSQPDASWIRALASTRIMLRSWIGRRARLEVDHDTVAAWMFAVREFPRLWRRGKFRRMRRNPRRICRKLLRKLEAFRKRAKRAARKKNLPLLSSQKEWRTVLAWVRRHLRWEAQLPKRIQLRKKHYQLLIAEAVAQAAREIAQRGYLVPSSEHLRRAVRLAFKSGRSKDSLQPGPRTLLTVPGLLFSKIRYRLPRLLRAPSPAPPPGKEHTPPKLSAVKPQTFSPPKKPVPHQKISNTAKLQPHVPDAEIQILQAEYHQLSLLERSERVLQVVALGISRRGLANRLAVSEGVIRRDLLIAALPPAAKAELSQGTSAMKLLAVHRRQKRLHLEKGTGELSSKGAGILVGLLEREGWAPSYSQRVVAEVQSFGGRRRRQRTRFLSPARAIKLSRPRRRKPTGGIELVNYMIEWVDRFSVLLIPEGEIRRRALGKTEEHFHQLVQGGPGPWAGIEAVKQKLAAW